MARNDPIYEALGDPCIWDVAPGKRHEYFRKRFYEIHGNICGICGKPVEYTELQIDHIIPLTRGGPHTYENLQVTHNKCNWSKGASPRNLSYRKPVLPAMVSLRVDEITQGRILELMEIWGDNKSGVIARCIERAYWHESHGTNPSPDA